MTEHDGEQSGRTPERLRAFREEGAESTLATRVVIIAGIALLVGVAFGFVGLRAIERDPRLMPAVRPGGLSIPQLRRLANSLDERGLPFESLAVYEQYLEEAPLNDQARAATSLHMARIASLAGDHERALRYVYQAEMLNGDPELQGSIDRLVLESLESLGRTDQLQRELAARARPRDGGEDAEQTSAPDDAPDDAPAGGRDVVVARVGTEVVSLAQFRAYKEQLPPSRLAEYANDGGDVELLRDAVAERLLLREGVRQGRHRDPEVQARLNSILNSLVVREMVNDVLDSVPEPDEAEARGFYDGHPELFTRVAHATVRVASAGTPGGDWAFSAETVPVRADAADDSSFPEAVRRTILETPPGQTTEPVEIDGRWYRFEVVSREESGVAPFDEARERAVELAWQAAREARFEAFQNELLMDDGVDLYPDRLGESSDTDAPADASEGAESPGGRRE